MRKDETTMKKGKKGLVLAGALLLTMLTLTGCGKTKINLNDYVEVNFSGYNTAGQAEIDELKIRNDIILDHWETFGLTEEQHENEQAAANEDTRQFVGSVSYSLDKISGLQNGDAVTLQWNVQEKELDELAKKIKAEFVYSDMTFTVEGLEEPEDWDPFEGTEINYRGKLPFVSVDYIEHPAGSDVPGLIWTNSDADFNNSAEESADAEHISRGLENGDTITVNISAPDGQDIMQFCAMQGKRPIALSKDFTVEGLDGYVYDFSQIPADLLQQMDEKVQGILQEEAENTWDWRLAEMKLLGNYFLCARDEGMSTPNYLYFIYEITAVDDSTGNSQIYYYYGRYRNLKIASDGTVSVDVEDVAMPDGKYYNWGMYAGEVHGEAFMKGDVYFIGYEHLNELYEDKVQQWDDRYICISTVNQ